MLTPLLTFALTVCHLLLPRQLILHLLSLFPLCVPLPSLQNQHAHKHERQYSIASRHHFQAIISPQEFFNSRFHTFDTDSYFPFDELAVVYPASNDPHTFDDIGKVDDDAAHLQHQDSAVKEHVGIRRLVQLDEETQDACPDDGVENAGDDGWRSVQELQVVFEHDVCFRRTRGWVPQDWVVVGEEGEEDAEGEACGWPARSALFGGEDW